MPRTRFIIADQPGSYAVWLGETGQNDRMESFIRWSGADKPAINNNPAPSCICQRLYDTGSTHYIAPIRLQSGKVVGHTDLDLWMRDELPHLAAAEGVELAPDWFKATYDAFAFGQGSAHPFLAKVKNRIEAACPATLHYQRLLDDQLVGRDVYCSTDVEKENELRDGMLDTWFDASHPWEIWSRTESRGADSGAGASDVLQRQREDRADAPAKPAGTLTLGADVQAATDHAERKALRTIARETEAPSAWLRLVWANKRKARAKNESARREIKRFLQKLDKYEDPAAISVVQYLVAEYGYVGAADYIWKLFASQLTRPKASA